MHSRVYWINAWNEFIDEHRAHHEFYMRQEYWDGLAEGYKKEDGTAEREARDEALADRLLKTTGIPEGARVLDVGCGPGNLSIPLARKGCRVTACDISPLMLERFAKDMPADLSFKPELYHLDWKDADIRSLGWENAFDLVIAHMTPAVNHPEGIDKMIMASSRHLFYAGFLGPRRSEPWNSVCRKFESSELRRTRQFSYYVLNYLLSSGYYPSMDHITNRWTKTGKKELLAEDYLQRLNIELDRERPVRKEEMLEYLESFSDPDGNIEIINSGQTAYFYWEKADL